MGANHLLFYVGMIRLASLIANKSKHKFRVGAVIVKGGRIVSSGCNKVGHPSSNRIYASVHAEEQAIHNLLIRNDLHTLANSVIYVSRIGADGRTRMAKPCDLCHKMIQSVGIKRIVYTTDTGIKEERL